MVSPILQELMQRADTLQADEKLILIAHLATFARSQTGTPTLRRAWQEIAGAAPHPLLGMDAQQWVTQSRREEEAV